MNRYNQSIIITGALGFIGSALLRYIFDNTDFFVVVIDKQTYAARVDALPENQTHRYANVCADINDADVVGKLLRRHRPVGIINLAAESHVDRAISGSLPFVRSNIDGTHSLLESVRHYLQDLPESERASFRFHQVSTDEVFGDLSDSGEVCFREDMPYCPSNPYSASKAAADHLVAAWRRTYGLNTVITHSGNNYGVRQHDEKFIPTVINAALSGSPIPIYGDGRQRRDWVYVDDHARALWLAFCRAPSGSRYLIGSGQSVDNLGIAHMICRILDMQQPHNAPHERLITHIADRAGHDRHYASDSSRIRQELGWKPQIGLPEGLARTVDYYRDQAV